MIAFVIVAAALAFVVLNMGLFTTNKTKQAISSSSDIANSALSISGKIVGLGDVSVGKLNATVIPVKIVSRGKSINIDPLNIAIRYIGDTIEHGNIYAGALTSTTYDTLSTAMDAAINAGYIDGNPVSGSGPNATKAIFYFNINKNQNIILEHGEHGMIAIAFLESERPQSLDVIRAEVILSKGAPLTIERIVPNISSNVVDLG